MFDPELQKQLKNKFEKELKDEVELILFGKDTECTFCLEYKDLIDELASLSSKITAKSHSISGPEAKEFGVRLAPSLVIYSPKYKTSATFCAPPANHFFITLLEDIVDASRGGPSISKDLIEKIAAIDFPVQLKVFASQTCPYCPPAVKVAHDFSLINPKIKAEMIDTSLFPELAQHYKVRGVPKTIINDSFQFGGAKPTSEVLDYVLQFKANP